MFPVQDHIAAGELQNHNPKPGPANFKARALESIIEAHLVDFSFHSYLLLLTYIVFLNNNVPDILKNLRLEILFH